MQSPTKQYLQHIIKEEYSNMLISEQSPYQNPYLNINGQLQNYENPEYSGLIGPNLDISTGYDFYGQQKQILDQIEYDPKTDKLPGKKIRFTLDNWWKSMGATSCTGADNCNSYNFPAKDTPNLPTTVKAWLRKWGARPVIFDTHGNTIINPAELEKRLPEYLKNFAKNEAATIKDLKSQYLIYYQLVLNYDPGGAKSPAALPIWFGWGTKIILPQDNPNLRAKQVVNYKFQNGRVEIVNSSDEVQGRFMITPGGGVEYKEISDSEKRNRLMKGYTGLIDKGNPRYKAMSDLSDVLYGWTGVGEMAITKTAFPVLYELQENQQTRKWGVNWSNVADNMQLTLDFVGIVGGPFVDVPNGLWYISRGRTFEGVLSIAASIPAVGDGMNIIVKKGLQAAIKPFIIASKGASVTFRTGRKIYMNLAEYLIKEGYAKNPKKYIQCLEQTKDIIKTFKGKVLTNAQVQKCIKVLDNMILGGTHIVEKLVLKNKHIKGIDISNNFKRRIGVSGVPGTFTGAHIRKRLTGLWKKLTGTATKLVNPKELTDLIKRLPFNTKNFLAKAISMPSKMAANTIRKIWNAFYKNLFKSPQHLSLVISSFADKKIVTKFIKMVQEEYFVRHFMMHGGGEFTEEVIRKSFKSGKLPGGASFSGTITQGTYYTTTTGKTAVEKWLAEHGVHQGNLVNNLDWLFKNSKKSFKNIAADVLIDLRKGWQDAVTGSGHSWGLDLTKLNNNYLIMCIADPMLKFRTAAGGLMGGAATNIGKVKNVMFETLETLWRPLQNGVVGAANVIYNEVQTFFLNITSDPDETDFGYEWQKHNSLYIPVANMVFEKIFGSDVDDLIAQTLKPVHQFLTETAGGITITPQTEALTDKNLMPSTFKGYSLYAEENIVYTQNWLVDTHNEYGWEWVREATPGASDIDDITMVRKQIRGIHIFKCTKRNGRFYAQGVEGAFRIATPDGNFGGWLDSSVNPDAWKIKKLLGMESKYLVAMKDGKMIRQYKPGYVDPLPIGPARQKEATWDRTAINVPASITGYKGQQKNSKEKTSPLRDKFRNAIDKYHKFKQTGKFIQT